MPRKWYQQQTTNPLLVARHRRLINFTSHLFSLDRAACALRLKTEINDLYGGESQLSRRTSPAPLLQS